MRISDMILSRVLDKIIIFLLLKILKDGNIGQIQEMVG